jgi:hypothetical protein
VSERFAAEKLFVRQHFIDFEHRFHSPGILHSAYACQGIYRQVRATVSAIHSGAFERLWTDSAGPFVDGHGLKVFDDYLDIWLRQGIEVRHPGSKGSNTAGLRNEPAQEARIPVFRYAVRRIQFWPECPSNAIDCVAFQTMRDEQLKAGLRTVGIQAS